MEDMFEKLQSVMSDPESMRQIQQLAEMLKTDEAAAPSMDTASPSEPEQDAQQDNDNSGGGLDFGRLMQVAKLLQGNGGQDADAALLLALRPHLKQERQKKIDQAVKLMRMYSMYRMLQESGMLHDLF